MLRWSDALRSLLLVAAVLGAVPCAASWDVASPGQPGQWTIYGRSAGGGSIGLPVASGDFDGDGRSDVVIAAMNADGGPEGDRDRAGEVVLVLSPGSISGELDLAALDRLGLPPGVSIIHGANGLDFLGTQVAAADLDGDGHDDVLIGAQNADGPEEARPNCGEVVIVWGGPNIGGRFLDLAAVQPGDPVTVLYGVESGDRLGIWVASGDFDGDGKEDALLGADQASGPDNARPHAGEVYVLYGGSHLRSRSAIDLADPGVPITTVYGIDAEDHSGSTVRGARVNTDSAADLMIGAGLNRHSASLDGDGQLGGHGAAGGDGPANDRSQAGEAYVVYGLAGYRPVTIDLASPPPSSVRIYGVDAGDAYGEELVAGDFNNDGQGDLALGALTADGPPGDSRVLSGEVALILGGTGLSGATIDLASPPAHLDLSFFYGAEAVAIAGDTMLFADLDQDGFDELVIASPLLSPPGRDQAGVFEIFFGTSAELPAAVDLAEPPGAFTRFSVMGAEPGDMLAYSAAVGDVDGDGFPDLVVNAMQADGAANLIENAGDVYVLSGYAVSEAAGRLVPTRTAARSVSPTATSPTISASATPSPSSTSTPRPTVTMPPTPGPPTRTRTSTPSATPTPTATRSVGCPADCDGNGAVTVEELIIGVNLALGVRPVQDCLRADLTGDGEISVDELVQAVRAALEGCVAEPSATPTATASSTASASPSSTSTATALPSSTPTATPTEAPGPRIVYFGLLRADNSLVPVSATTRDGIPIYERPFSFGFSLVVEAVRGPSGALVALQTYVDFECSDLEIQVTRPLGNGNPAVCEPLLGGDPGGVPAADPPIFSEEPAACERYGDFACRFVDGSGRMVGRRCTEDACVKFETAEFGCASPQTEAQFCGLVDTSIGFPPGDTLVTARVRDVDGNLGAPAQIIVRITGF